MKGTKHKELNYDTLFKRCFHYLVPAVVKDYDFSAALWWSGLRYHYNMKNLEWKKKTNSVSPIMVFSKLTYIFLFIRDQYSKHYDKCLHKVNNDL